MEPDPVADAAEFAETVLTASHSHAFEKAVHGFVQVLATVPDYPPAMIADDAVRALLPLSEQVIEQIEQRIITQQDGGRGSVTLSRPCTRFAACSKTSTAGVVITAAFELGSSWNLEGLAPRQLVRYLSRNYVCPCYPRI